MINKGLWRHRRCKDIDFYINKVTYRGAKYVKAKVLYVYRHEGHPEIGGKPIFHNLQTVKIQLKDLKNWEKIGI